MDKLLESIFKAPVTTLIIVAGLAFLLIAVLGNIGDKIQPGKTGRITSGTIGAILLVIGLLMLPNLPISQVKSDEVKKIDSLKRKVIDLEKKLNRLKRKKDDLQLQNTKFEQKAMHRAAEVKRLRQSLEKVEKQRQPLQARLTQRTEEVRQMPEEDKRVVQQLQAVRKQLDAEQALVQVARAESRQWQTQYTALQKELKRLKTPSLKYKLVVRAIPADSTIIILDADDTEIAYTSDVKLKPGQYDILIKRKGYVSERQQVKIADRDVSHNIILEKIEFSPHYNLALFPLYVDPPEDRTSVENYDTTMLEQILRVTKSFNIVFSYHNEENVNTMVRKFNLKRRDLSKVWNNFGKPNYELILNIGRKLEVDSVVMYKFKLTFGQDYTNILLFDIKDQLKCSRDVTTEGEFLNTAGRSEVLRITKEVFGDYKKRCKKIK